MDYQEFLARVKELEFIGDEETADQAVTSVLGVLAGQIAEPVARRMAEELPEPLTYERLRGEHEAAPEIPTEDYVRELGEQFNLRYAESHRLIKAVFEATKASLNKETLNELEKKMPEDWVELLKSA